MYDDEVEEVPETNEEPALLVEFGEVGNALLSDPQAALLAAIGHCQVRPEPVDAYTVTDVAEYFLGWLRDSWRETQEADDRDRDIPF